MSVFQTRAPGSPIPAKGCAAVLFLNKAARLLQHSTPGRSDSGQGPFPPSSLLFSDPQSPNPNSSGAKEKEPIMNSTIQFKTTTRALLIALVLLCPRLPDQSASGCPAAGRGYPNFNTAEGQKALFSLTTGSANTAVGWFSLFSNATPASTPLPAQDRSFSTPQTKIRRLARRRFYSTPPAPTTQPLELPPF